jgi:GT2 family glycosyltransferase
VVNWNVAEAATRCLRAVARELATVSGECIVIDNASFTGDVAGLGDACPEADIVRNPRNVGFAAAANQGVRRGRGRYVLLLNPDAFLGEGTLRHLVEYLDAHPVVGLVGPRILNPDGSLQGSARGFPGPLTAFFGRSSILTRLFPGNALTRRNLPALSPMPRGPMPVDQMPMPVDWVSGGCVMIRREAFEQVGGFDEQFVMYWEDADLCWRLHQAGWQVWYDPRVPVVHTVGASSEQALTRCTIEFHRSAYRIYRKQVTGRAWHPMNGVAAVGLTIRASLLLAARLARRSWQGVGQVAWRRRLAPRVLQTKRG